MGETAEERRLRLALQNNALANVLNSSYGAIKRFWSNDDYDYEYYEQILDDICKDMIDEVCEEPKIGLVKKYNKGSFKFV
tara:strand:- start:176 stop:415 length:240 start_codon:yes stop_codon:yes gene_type:complete